MKLGAVLTLLTSIRSGKDVAERRRSRKEATGVPIEMALVYRPQVVHLTVTFSGKG